MSCEDDRCREREERRAVIAKMEERAETKRKERKDKKKAMEEKMESERRRAEDEAKAERVRMEDKSERIYLTIFEIRPKTHSVSRAQDP